MPKGFGGGEARPSRGRKKKGAAAAVKKPVNKSQAELLWELEQKARAREREREQQQWSEYVALLESHFVRPPAPSIHFVSPPGSLHTSAPARREPSHARKQRKVHECTCGMRPHAQLSGNTPCCTLPLPTVAAPVQRVDGVHTLRSLMTCA